MCNQTQHLLQACPEINNFLQQLWISKRCSQNKFDLNQNYNIFRKYKIYLLEHDHLQPMQKNSPWRVVFAFCRIYAGGLIFTRIDQNFDQYNVGVLKGLQVNISPRFLCRPTVFCSTCWKPCDVRALSIRKTADLPLQLWVGTFPRFVAIGFYFLS